ncbi:MAG: class I SAM-dependent methyltransferase [Candidatus Micrarchaeota archaeon]|nr:class I SAM-dependent methyltransferase [Candidatus Micrarchaeota archaeon]
MAEFDKAAKIYDDSCPVEFMGDTSFYLREAKKARGKVLEVGCGTGRVYLPLLAAGIDVYGIDISRGMLKVLEKKAASAGLSPKSKLADMRNFKMSQRFALIIVPFRAFLHNLTFQDQISSLKCFRRHLAPGGKLILNFFYPSHNVMVNDYGREIVRFKKGGFMRKDFSVFSDETEQIVKSCYWAIKNNKKISSYTVKIAFIYKREFELLLRLAGFSSWQVFGGFKKERLVSSKQEMVWVVKR